MKDVDKFFYLISLVFVLASAHVGYGLNPILGIALLIQGLKFCDRTYLERK